MNFEHSTSNLLASDQLGDEVLEQVNFLIDATQVPGTLIGAIVAGQQLYDLRPVLLNRGKLGILRLADPQSLISWVNLKAAIDSQATLSSLSIFISSGFHQNIPWFYRSYCQANLLDKLQDMDRADNLAWCNWCYNVIKQLHRLHSAGFIHGHIGPDNILFDGDSVFLVDPQLSFSSYSRRQLITDWAPELILANASLQPSADLFGLGLVLQIVCQKLGWKDLGPLVEELLTNNAAIRPSLAEVTDRFERFCQILLGTKDLVPTEGNPPEDVLHWVKGTQSLSPKIVSKIQSMVMMEAHNQMPAQPIFDNELQSKPVKLRETIEPSRTKITTPGGVIEKPSYVLSLIFATALLLGSGLFFSYRQGWLSTNYVELEDPETLWKSGIPSEMQQVALAAISNEDRGRSRMVIIREVIANKNYPGVRTEFLRFLYSNPWEKEFVEEDHEMILKLGLAELVSDQVKSLPDLSQVHPIVIFSTLALMQLDGGEGLFGKLEITALENLPTPFGNTISFLKDQGITDITNPILKMLAKLAVYGTGSGELPNLLSYFENERDVRILVGASFLILSSDSSSLELYLSALLAGNSVYQKFNKWFDDNLVVDWKGFSKFSRALLIAGLSKDDLSIDYLADLLKFPADNVRVQASKKLVSLLSESDRDTIELLADPQFPVSRNMVVLLVSSLFGTEQVKGAILAKFFELNPEPKILMEILASRAAVQGFDLLSVEIARRLKDQDIKFDIDILQKLFFHNEELVRSLAYSALDSNNPLHQELLKAAITSESNERLLEALKEKLQLFESATLN